ncbi:MAG: undecaprenyl/decaprenyl-phosphate alpha-N-acetylglucosaminyl 1-phosphate transferase [Candidatus Aminicenantes bacterium]|nr:undecaprenyl/decaprenyl-phosphate alpha-N-acetylglucosaminyl 1-phosphate transferase [Candidatus Aminicenantes bacterium]
MEKSIKHTKEPKFQKISGTDLWGDWLGRYSFLWRIVLGACLVLFCVLLLPPVRAVLENISGKWLHVFLVSLLASLILTSQAVWLALRFGAVDIPDKRKIHDKPTPRLGGLAVFMAILVAVLLNKIQDVQLLALLIGAGILFSVGVADDLFCIPAKLRLIVQILLSVGMVLMGVMLKPFPRDIFLGEAGNIFLTIIWFVGITNAFNFFDGMDGLASGLAIQIGVFISIVAFSTHQIQLGWISVAVVGASFGFLPHNLKMRKPGEIFLGDSGSMVLGFLLAGLAVRAEWAVGHPLLTLSPPLLVFGVLIYDMVHTTVARIVRGDVRTFKQWIEFTGKDHLHHRFEALLRSKRFSVVLVLTLNLSLALAALIIRYITLSRALILLLQCIVILILVTILERAGNLRERRKGSFHSD